MTDENKKEDYFFLSCFDLWELCFSLLWLVFSDFQWLGKCFSNWWSGCAWRWSNVDERNWPGHTAWLSSLADSSGVAEQSKLSAALDMGLSTEGEEKVESSCTEIFMEKLERPKSVINYKLGLRWNLKQIQRWTKRSGSARNQGCSFWSCSSWRALDWSFQDKKCRKWGWTGTSGSRAGWNLVKQALGTVTMLVKSGVWFLCRFVCQLLGEIWFTPWKL